MTAMKKDIEIKFTERVLKEVAVDCLLHRRSTIRYKVDYSRDCDYMQCASLTCTDEEEYQDADIELYVRFFFDYGAFTELAKEFFLQEWSCSVVIFRDWLIADKDIFLSSQEVLLGLGYTEYTQAVMKNPYGKPAVVASKNDIFFITSSPNDPTQALVNQAVSVTVIQHKPEIIQETHEKQLLEQIARVNNKQQATLLMQSTNSTLYQEFILEHLPTNILLLMTEYTQVIPNIGIRSNINVKRFFKNNQWLDGDMAVVADEVKVNEDLMEQIGIRGVYGKDKFSFAIQKYPVQKKHKGRVCKTVNKVDIVAALRAVDPNADISGMSKTKLCELLYDLMEERGIMVVAS
jgi:hypothetical protein